MSLALLFFCWKRWPLPQCGVWYCRYFSIWTPWCWCCSIRCSCWTHSSSRRTRKRTSWKKVEGRGERIYIQVYIVHFVNFLQWNYLILMFLPESWPVKLHMRIRHLFSLVSLNYFFVFFSQVIKKGMPVNLDEPVSFHNLFIIACYFIINFEGALFFESMLMLHCL